ncbi:MAG: Nif11-like leader peptide family natural product precursor [Blastocatellia bacterium]
MSENGLEQFRQLALQDEALQKQLRETAGRQEFIALMLRLGAERDYGFTAEEVEEALSASWRARIERWV